ncbi:MAG: hypothetical protein DRI01_04540 [Chloroflexi bacterium]|nr:MAG: hypothetical protein DRI01_04540 [Chloroflexota bacterium]
MGEIITFYAETDGSNTTGDFTLDSDVLHSTVSYIRPDKGYKLKIWAWRVAGAPVTVLINYTNDVTVGSPTWKTIGAIHLSSEGIEEMEKRKPVIVLSKTGKEAVKFSWSQSAAGVSRVGFEVEFSFDES